MLTRREFSRYFLVGGSGLLASGRLSAGEFQASANQSAKLDCDLLIKGGTVIDPGQGLQRGVAGAVKDGKILVVTRDLPEAGARTVVSAKDKIVTPGFID